MQWLALLLLMVLLGAATWFELQRERSRVLQAEQVRLVGQVHMVDENIGHQFRGVDAALESVREDMGFFRGSADLQGSASRRLTALAAAMPGVASMLVADVDGTIIASNRDELLGLSVRDRGYFQVPSKRPDRDALYVSEPFTTDLNVYSLNLVKILVDGRGQFAGIVSATLDPYYFSVTFSPVLYAPDVALSLVHAGGKVLMAMPDASSEGTEVSGPGSAFSRHRGAAQAQSLLTDVVGAHGENRIVALHTVAPSGVPMDRPLVLQLSRDSAAVLEPWHAKATLYAQAYALLAMLLFGGVYLLQRKQGALLDLSAARDKDAADHLQRMNLALAGADLGMWDLDLRTGRREVNARAQEMVGFTLGDRVDDIEAWAARTHPDDLDASLAARQDHEAGRTDSFITDYRVQHRDGHWVWIHSRGKVTQRDAQGTALRITGTYQDVTEQKRAQEQIRELAFHDPLTQLPNRRLLMDRLGQARRSSARSGMSGALLLLDLDDFKWVNDNLGHGMGDLVLQQLSARLLECVRHSDTVARIGGDEFVVLVQNLGASRAEALEQVGVLAKKIESAMLPAFHLGAQSHALTVSIGAAVFCGKDEPAERLFREADQAMYAAKSARRKRSAAMPAAADSVQQT